MGSGEQGGNGGTVHLVVGTGGAQLEKNSTRCGIHYIATHSNTMIDHMTFSQSDHAQYHGVILM